MATTLEIINGISQVLSKKYDGALDENDEPLKIGLKREGDEDTNPLIDSRVMDGFGVQFGGNKLFITYSSEIKLKEVYGGTLENDVSSMISDIAAFLKKEYRALTKSSLSITADGDVNVLVQPVSRVRTLVTARQAFNIGGVDEQLPDRPGLDIPSTPEAKKTPNDKRKSDPFESFKAYDFANRKR
jgi:hypothetical protein|tara:strand:- start:1804 stop:2361 length:558 start_codon:yes stop_codon:yes gene_type:complete